jgi:site-specific recombinase XerD
MRKALDRIPGIGTITGQVDNIGHERVKWDMSDEDAASPLFRTAEGRTRRLTRNAVGGKDVLRMVKRRFKDAGLPATMLTCHTFRATTITDLLNQGVPLEDVQQLAGHADPRTTRLYDRRRREVTRNIVERISI